MPRGLRVLALLAVMPPATAWAQDPTSAELRPGEPRRGTIDHAADPFTTPQLAGGGHRSVSLRLAPCPDEAMTLAVRSVDFDAFLQIVGRDGKVIAQADSGGGNGDAQLVLRGRALAGATLLVVSKRGEPGEYEVELRRGAGAPNDPAQLLARAEQALARCEQRHGPDTPPVADRWLWLARTLRAAARLEDALAAIERARTIREANDESPELQSECWRESGLTHAQAGRARQAIAAFEQCRTLLAVDYGERHRGLPALCFDLAEQQLALGERDPAIATLRDGIRIFDQQRNPDLAVRAALTLRLTGALSTAGDHAAARRCALDAVPTALASPNTLGTANLQLRLASLLLDYAEPAAARELLTRCAPTLRTNLPATHRRRVELAWFRGALAHATARQDELRSAVAELRELLATPGVDLPWSEANLRCGIAELAIGESPAAVVDLLAPHLPALATSAPGSADHARMLGLLALALHRSGRGDAARRALDGAFEAGSPFASITPDQLDRLRIAGAEVLEESDPARARECTERLIARAPVWPELAQVTRLDHLACLHVRTGDLAAAGTVAMRATTMALQLLERDLPALSDEDGLQLYTAVRPTFDLLLSVCRRSGDRAGVDTLYEHVAAWRTRVLRGEIGDRKRARERHDEATLSLLERLREIDRATASVQDMRTGDAARRAARRDELAEERRDIERRLADLAPASGGPSAPSPATLRQHLAADAAFVDFVAFERRISADPAATTEIAAFVVRHDGPVRVHWLGSAAAVEAALTPALDVVGRRLRPDAAGRTIEKQALRRLADLVLAPLQPLLAGVRTLAIATDGAMAMVPFAALPGLAPDHLLLEDLELIMVGSAADLVATPRAAGRPSLLLLGDVDFGAPAPLPRLPGTAREIDAIAATARELLPADSAVTLLRGAAATPDAFAETAPTHSLVHLATHGLRPAATMPRTSGSESITPSSRSDSTARRMLAANQAGLALAGANLAPAGVLSGNRLSWLDLTRCELAVLSACETGRGEPLAGEQLLGLRRALRLAGARRTATTLWRVDDDRSVALLADFYRELWGHGVSPAAALRAAQLARLAANRRAYDGDPLPATWAGYVVEGER